MQGFENLVYVLEDLGLLQNGMSEIILNLAKIVLLHYKT